MVDDLLNHWRQGCACSPLSANSYGQIGRQCRIYKWRISRSAGTFKLAQSSLSALLFGLWAFTSLPVSTKLGPSRATRSAGDCFAGDCQWADLLQPVGAMARRLQFEVRGRPCAVAS